MTDNLDKTVCSLAFEAKDDGLAVHPRNPRDNYEFDDIERTPTYYRPLTLNAEASSYHGIIEVPARLPRYLMPEWQTNDWSRFIEEEVGFIQSFIDESLVICLSLALNSDPPRRNELLKNTNAVVIDFRGDLPNMYLPMSLGGYKIGVYRNGNNWPLWLSIQPT